MSRPMSWRYFAGVIGHWALRGFGFWAVEEKDSKRLIGGVGLWYPEGWPEPELAYWLMPQAQGKGYATEAGLKVIEVAFDVMRLETLVSYMNPENNASIRVAERLVDGLAQRTAGLAAAVGAQAVPVEGVVPDLRGIVEQAAVGRADDFLERGAHRVYRYPQEKQ